MSEKLIKIKLNSITSLKDIICSLKDLVDEACFKFTSEKITMQAMDSSSIAICFLLLKKDMFSSYQIPNEVNINISLENFSKILKIANQDDSLELSLEQDQSFLKIVLSNEKTKKKSKFDFKITSGDSSTTINIPEIDYSYISSINSKDFRTVINDYKYLSNETINITINKNSILFKSSGLIGQSDTEIPITLLKDISEPISYTFSTKYLLDFTRTILSDNVTIFMVSENPLCLEYSMPYGLVKYYLAPKMDDE